MKLAVLLIAGSAIAVPAQAQTATVGSGFTPLPDMSPAYLFAPNPLSGTLLKPLLGPTPKGGAEVMPEPGPDPVIVAQTLPGTEIANAPSAATPPEAAAPEAAPAEAAPEEPAAPVEAVEEEAPAPAPKTSRVTVIVENVESNRGVIRVAVCDKGLSREGCPYSHEIPAHAGFVETEFDDIPPGTYAVVGYHDVNANNEFDKLFGMPREPYALSSKAANMLVPSFADAALPINAGNNAVIIRLKRLGG